MDIPYKVVYFRSKFALSKHVVLQAHLGPHRMEKYIYRCFCGKEICILDGKENAHDWAAT